MGGSDLVVSNTVSLVSGEIKRCSVVLSVDGHFSVVVLVVATLCSLIDAPPRQGSKILPALEILVAITIHLAIVVPVVALIPAESSFGRRLYRSLIGR